MREAGGVASSMIPACRAAASAGCIHSLRMLLAHTPPQSIFASLKSRHQRKVPPQARGGEAQVQLPQARGGEAQVQLPQARGGQLLTQSLDALHEAWLSKQGHHDEFKLHSDTLCWLELGNMILGSSLCGEPQPAGASVSAAILGQMLREQEEAPPDFWLVSLAAWVMQLQPLSNVDLVQLHALVWFCLLVLDTFGWPDRGSKGGKATYLCSTDVNLSQSFMSSVHAKAFQCASVWCAAPRNACQDALLQARLRSAVKAQAFLEVCLQKYSSSKHTQQQAWLQSSQSVMSAVACLCVFLCSSWPQASQAAAQLQGHAPVCFTPLSSANDTASPSQQSYMPAAVHVQGSSSQIHLLPSMRLGSISPGLFVEFLAMAQTLVVPHAQLPGVNRGSRNRTAPCTRSGDVGCAPACERPCTAAGRVPPALHTLQADGLCPLLQNSLHFQAVCVACLADAFGTHARVRHSAEALPGMRVRTNAMHVVHATYRRARWTLRHKLLMLRRRKRSSSKL